MLDLKKNGTPCFCVDYWKLNGVTILDSCPIPRLQNCIDWLNDATIIPTLETKHQIFFKSKLGKRIEATQCLHLTEVFSALHKCLLIEKRLEQVSTNGEDHTYKKQIAVCPHLSRGHRYSSSSARQTFQPCWTSSYDITQREGANNPGKRDFLTSCNDNLGHIIRRGHCKVSTCLRDPFCWLQYVKMAPFLPLQTELCPCCHNFEQKR